MFHGFEAESNADEYHHPHYLCRRLHGSCHPATAADPTAQGVIAIVALVCCFNLMGDALRDALDPAAVFGEEKAAE